MYVDWSNSVCVKQTYQSQVQLLKCHHYDIETIRYSSAIYFHMRIHSTKAHINFCQAGSQVGTETFDKQ